MDTEIKTDAAAGSTSAAAENKIKCEDVRLEDCASDSDSVNTIPVLEDAAAGTTPISDGATGVPIQLVNVKLSRGERKARRMMSKMGLKPIKDVNRVVIRKTNNILFVIEHPDVYKHPQNDTYIVFGEVQIEDLSQKANAAAAEKFKPPAAAGTSVAPVAVEDEVEVDETGVDEQDIELVIQQANTTRARAVRALKQYDNDIVNAIMELTIV